MNILTDRISATELVAGDRVVTLAGPVAVTTVERAGVNGRYVRVTLATGRVVDYLTVSRVDVVH